MTARNNLALVSGRFNIVDSIKIASVSADASSMFLRGRRVFLREKPVRAIKFYCRSSCREHRRTEVLTHRGHDIRVFLYLSSTLSPESALLHGKILMLERNSKSTVSLLRENPVQSRNFCHIENSPGDVTTRDEKSTSFFTNCVLRDAHPWTAISDSDLFC